MKKFLFFVFAFSLFFASAKTAKSGRKKASEKTAAPAAKESEKNGGGFLGEDASERSEEPLESGSSKGPSDSVAASPPDSSQSASEASEKGESGSEKKSASEKNEGESEKKSASEKSDSQKSGDGKSGAASENSFQKKYSVFRSSSKKIRMLETQADIFSSSQFLGEKRVLTSVSQGELQRRFYDENFRLQKKEWWQIASSSAQSKMRKIFTYEFFESGKIRSITERDFFENTSAFTFFNADGKIRSQRKNQFAEGVLSSFEIFTCEYDREGNVAEEKKVVFSVSGKRQKKILSQSTKYKYKGQKIFEISFYENSVLRVRKIFESEDKFVQTTYFDGGYSVRDFYEGGAKVSSSFSGGGSKN